MNATARLCLILSIAALLIAPLGCGGGQAKSSADQGVAGDDAANNADGYHSAGAANRPAMDLNRNVGRSSGLLDLEAEVRESDAMTRRSMARLSGDTDFEASGGESLDEDYRSGHGSGEAAKDGKADDPDEPVETWKRSQLVPNTSRLMVGDNEELALRGMEVRVRVEGLRARVILDSYFLNDRNSQLEGTFQVRLPDGARVGYLAFGQTVLISPNVNQLDDQQINASVNISDIDASFDPTRIAELRSKQWTQPKVARIVPNEKAAHAYVETRRRRVDPALMEWQGAGVFSGRIFPLMPRTLHRVVISYDVDLLRVGNEVELDIHLPYDVPRADATIVVNSTGLTPVAVQPSQEPKAQDGYLLYGWRHLERQSEPRIRLRLKPSADLLVTSRDRYFSTRVRPDLPSSVGGVSSADAVFLLDVSLSANPDRFNIWVKLLQAVLAGDTAIKRFNVLCFNIESFWYRAGGVSSMVPNTPAERQKLEDWLQTLALEGATDIGAALETLAAGNWPAEGDGNPRRVDTFLLSDAAATWGEDDAQAMTRHLLDRACRVIGYTTGLGGTSIETLQALTNATAGAIIPVVGESEIAAAATAHMKPAWRILDVHVPGTSDVFLNGRPTVVYPGMELHAVGRFAADSLPADKATTHLTLKLASPAGATLTLKVPLTVVAGSTLARRAFGQAATAQLELVPQLEKTAVAFAQHFRVPGKVCSLLMLESEADYERFQIKDQDTATVVELCKVSEALVEFDTAALAALADPKARFERMLQMLERAPGMSFSPDATFEMLVRKLTRDDFALPVRTLRCTPKSRTWDGVAPELTEYLASHDISYDAMVAEANRRLAEGNTGAALKALSTLVENRPGDHVLARDVGFTAMEWGLDTHAVPLFARVIGTRPWEPQTYHALARALTAAGKPELATLYYELGVTADWDGRFGAYRRIVAADYQRHLRKLAADGGRLADFAKQRVAFVQRIVGFATADVFISITWNTDNSDIDLHVQEPGGEHCFYEHNRTAQGAFLTQDVTQGYGPEMYVVPTARQKGTYRVWVDYFSANANRASARTRVFVTWITGYGTANEQVHSKAVTLVVGKDIAEVVTLKVR